MSSQPLLQETEKLAIATELLDRALFLYYEGNSYFASLHLAGAAEEVLGAYIKKRGGESSFESLRKAAISFSASKESSSKAITSLMNHAKNSTKHMDDLKGDRVSFDVKSEAKDLLDRAVSNYYQLMMSVPLKETLLLQRFNKELISP